MTKIYITIIAVLTITIGGLITDNLRLRKNLIQIELAIDSQNKQIEEARIEVEEYKNKKPQIVEKIVEVYKDKVEVITNEEAEKSLEACVQKVKNYNTLLDTYNKRSMQFNGIDISTLENKDNTDGRESK